MTQDILQPSNTSCNQCHSSDTSDCTHCQTSPTCPPSPSHMKDDDGKEDTTISCFNCHTNTTPLWRRDSDGHCICNACGLYFKLHMTHRPVTMMRSVIKRRKRGSDRRKEMDKDPKKIKSVPAIKMVHSPLPPPPPQQQQQQKDRAATTVEPTKLPPPPIMHSTLSPSSAFYPPPPPSSMTPYHQHHTSISHSSGPCHHIQDQQEKRHYLQSEVTRLTRLLNETTTMLSSIDKALEEEVCSQCQHPQEQQVAQSLLSLAQSQSSTCRLITPSSSVASSPTSTPPFSPTLSPPLSLSPTSTPTSPLLSATHHHHHHHQLHLHHPNQDAYPKLPPIMMFPNASSSASPSSSSLLPAISALHSL